MKALRELLSDRRRSQRGSVLSGVLIIVAFLSIVIGAVMTELSASFLLSRSLVNRVVTQATLDSAVESSFNQLQNTPLGAACPAPSTVTLNGQTAVATYLKCFSTVDSRTQPQFMTVASSTAAFTTDGTHVVLPRVGRDEFLVGDRSATVYEFAFGQSAPGWTAPVEGSLTGPPTAIVDMTTFPYSILDLVPVTDPTSPNCATSCVSVLHEQLGSSPQPQCLMPAAGPVTGRVAPGVNLPLLAFFGDASGTLWAYAPGGGEDGCALLASNSQLNQAIVQGPIVFPGSRRTTDEIYVLASDGDSSQLVHYTYSQSRSPSLRFDAALRLPAPNVAGFAVDQSTLPARIAITFSSGQVAVAQVATDFGMSLSASGSVPTSISRAPFWCHCPSGDLIGVGGATGLFLLDPGLNLFGTYSLTGTVINTTPTADGAGDWFFGADDGTVYEVQRPPGQAAMTLATTFGKLGAKVGSSTTMGPCPAGLCIYVATRNGRAFLIPVDARDAVLSACLSSAPPSCSGANPRLWASVEVGAMGSPQTVHVTGWSYYSP